MNGVDVVSDVKQFCFNPPSIQSIECQNGTCILHGISFGMPNNTIITVSVYSGAIVQKQIITSSNMTTITVNDPDSLLLKLGSKTVTVDIDGIISLNFTFSMTNIVIKGYDIKGSTINDQMIYINISDICLTPKVQFSNESSLNTTNNVIGVLVAPFPESRNTNIKVLCSNVPPIPFLVILTPTLTNSTKSNTTGPIITIYGHFISPIDSDNQSLPISIMTSTNQLLYLME